MNANQFPADADVDQWQRDYQPTQGGQRAGPEVLPDGNYDFEITSAELSRTTKNPETIFRLGLRVLGGAQAGVQLERATFFRRQESVDYLGGELLTLGFDADQWGRRGATWSQELAAACGRLVGMRFSGMKTSKAADKPGERYHNLFIGARLAGGSMPSAPANGPAQPPRQTLWGGTAKPDEAVPF